MDAAARRRPADFAGALPGRRRRANASSRSTPPPASRPNICIWSPEKGDKIISIDDLDGLIALVQAGVLEIHTRGTTIDDRERADRLVFDLDPGPGTGWKDVVAAAREVRDAARAHQAQELSEDLGRQGPARRAADQAGAVGHGQRFLPRRRRAAWRRTIPTATSRPPPRAKRNKPHFRRLSAQQPRGDGGRALLHPRAAGRAGVDADRLVRTRQRSKAPISTPCNNAMQRLARLRKDPWAAIGRIRQTLPKFK